MSLGVGNSPEPSIQGSSLFVSEDDKQAHVSEQFQRGYLRLESGKEYALEFLSGQLHELQAQLNKSGINDRDRSLLHQKISEIEELINQKVPEIFNAHSEELVAQMAAVVQESGGDFVELSKKMNAIAFDQLSKAHKALAQEVLQIQKGLSQAVSPSSLSALRGSGSNILLEESHKKRLFHSRDNASYEAIKAKIREADKMARYEQEVSPKFNTTIVKSHSLEGRALNSRITPVTDMPDSEVAGMDQREMYASFERKTAPGVVNHWRSEVSGEDGSVMVSFQRSGVLSTDRKTVEKQLRATYPNLDEKALQQLTDSQFERMNGDKVNEVLSLAGERQLKNPAQRQLNDDINERLKYIQDHPEASDEELEGHGIRRVGSSYEFTGLVLEANHSTCSLLNRFYDEEIMHRGEEAALRAVDGKEVPLNLVRNGVAFSIPIRWSTSLYCFPVADVSAANIYNADLRSGIRGSAIQTALEIKEGASISKRVNSANREAFEKTKARYQAFMARDDVSKDDKALAEGLMGQVVECGLENWNNVGNAYALGARLMYLENLMDGSAHIHCKSGKDRTSLMDAEIKYIATFYRNHGELPPVNVKQETDLHRTYRNTFILEGGNLEITELNNVTAMGIKTTDKNKETVAKMGGKDVARKAAGESKYAKS